MTEEKHVSTLKERFESLSSQSLKNLRSKSWERFEALGLPNRKNELWKYVKSRKLLTPSSFAKETPQVDPSVFFLPESSDSTLVFVNGSYSPSLSKVPQNVTAMELSKASTSFGAFLNNQWGHSLKNDTDPYATLNGALHEEGLFLYIPPNKVIESPIHLLHIVSSPDSIVTMPRTHVFVGAQSEASLITQTIAWNNEHGVNQVLEFSIEEGANVSLYQMDSEQQASNWHLTAIRGQLKKNSVFSSLSTTMGSATTRHDYRLTMLGENAEVSLEGLALLHHHTEAHTNVLIEHKAPNCRSNQLFKSVLDGASRSSFEGKIFVDPIAQKTEAYQLNSNIVLDDKASANCKPNLEIFADDVKASHGATIGQLDPEQLFYLKARGLTERHARSLLIRGFCMELLEKIPTPLLRNVVTDQVYELWYR